MSNNKKWAPTLRRALTGAACIIACSFTAPASIAAAPKKAATAPAQQQQQRIGGQKFPSGDQTQQRMADGQDQRDDHRASDQRQPVGTAEQRAQRLAPLAAAA